jgi:ribonuclease VapC
LTLFVDASALVAIIAGEPEQEEFAIRLRDAEDPIWSAMCCWEAVSSLRRFYGMEIEEARDEVMKTGERGALRLVPIADAELTVALDAYHRYGKGRHPARLNMGDCFAYACARTNEATLLYKGDDFALTDLA